MPIFVKKYQDQRKNGNLLWYFRAIQGNIVDIDTMSEEIQDMCSMTKSDVKGILLELVTVMREITHQGNQVHIEGLGTFSIRINSRGFVSEKMFDIERAVKRAFLAFQPERFKIAPGKFANALTQGLTVKLQEYPSGHFYVYPGNGTIKYNPPHNGAQVNCESGLLYTLSRGGNLVTSGKIQIIYNGQDASTLKYPKTFDAGTIPVSSILDPQYINGEISIVS